MDPSSRHCHYLRGELGAMEYFRERRTHPDVKLSRPDAFWDTHSVDNGSSDVEESHENEPMEGSELESFQQTICNDVMHGGNDPAQPQPDEHACPHWPKLGLGKLVPHGNHNTTDAQHKDQDQVGDLRLQTAVEAVVKPGHEGTHGQEGNATVVQPA